MSRDVRLQKAPGELGLFLRVLTSRKPGRVGPDGLGRFQASLEPAVPAPERVAAYRQLCGFAPSSCLPPTFPHLVGSGLHLVLVTQPEFPIKALGIVHVANEIVQHRPIEADEELAVTCWLDGHRDAPRGVMVDLVTEVRSGGELVWQSTSTALSMTKRTGSGAAKTDELPALPERRRFDVPADTGRRYGRVSQDKNPIHMWALTARPFGFDRAIVHGMWALARVVADLGAADACRIGVDFKRPIFMPSTVVLGAEPLAGGHRFDLRAGQSGKAHLLGRIEPLS